MGIQDQVVADQAAVDAAQAALDQAREKLEQDQAALNAIAPHLSVIAEIEAEAEKLGDEAKAVFHGLASKLRSLF